MQFVNFPYENVFLKNRNRNHDGQSQLYLKEMYTSTLSKQTRRDAVLIAILTKPRRAFQLTNCLHLVGLLACLWGCILIVDCCRRTQSILGGIISSVEVPELEKIRESHMGARCCCYHEPDLMNFSGFELFCWRILEL